MQQYLITYSEACKLARSISQHVDRERIDTFIREAETLDVKPVLGDMLYIAVKRDPVRFTALLQGGVYECPDGTTRSFEGLKSALAYFVYARFVRSSDAQVSRVGFVNKDNEHTSRTNDAEKERVYNDALAIGQRYLQECMEFVRYDAPCRACCSDGREKRGRYKVLGE